MTGCRKKQLGMRSDHSFFGSLSVKMQRPQRNADYGMDEKTVGRKMPAFIYR